MNKNSEFYLYKINQLINKEDIRKFINQQKSFTTAYLVIKELATKEDQTELPCLPLIGTAKIKSIKQYNIIINLYQHFADPRLNMVGFNEIYKVSLTVKVIYKNKGNPK